MSPLVSTHDKLRSHGQEVPITEAEVDWSRGCILLTVTPQVQLNGLGGISFSINGRDFHGRLVSYEHLTRPIIAHPWSGVQEIMGLEAYLTRLLIDNIVDMR